MKKVVNMDILEHWTVAVQPLDSEVTTNFLTRHAMRQA
jgi:hypothetical protein